MWKPSYKRGTFAAGGDRRKLSYVTADKAAGGSIQKQKQELKVPKRKIGTKNTQK